MITHRSEDRNGDLSPIIDGKCFELFLYVHLTKVNIIYFSKVKLSKKNTRAESSEKVYLENEKIRKTQDESYELSHK